MSKINVTTNTFPDIVVAYLFDKVLHPEDISNNNELFDKFIEKLKGRGIIPLLRDYYLSMDPKNRVKYKLISDAFEGITTSNAVISIVPEKFDKAPEKEKEDGAIKKIAKKMLGVLKASNEFDESELNMIEERITMEED